MSGLSELQSHTFNFTLVQPASYAVEEYIHRDHIGELIQLGLDYRKLLKADFSTWLIVRPRDEPYITA